MDMEMELEEAAAPEAKEEKMGLSDEVKAKVQKLADQIRDVSGMDPAEAISQCYASNEGDEAGKADKAIQMRKMERDLKGAVGE